MNFYFAADFSTAYLLPAVAVGEVRCADPACGEVHGWLIRIGFLFWAAGFAIWKIPPGEAPQI